MSHTNYSKMSAETNVEDAIEMSGPIIDDAFTETIGTVVNCAKLNIRTAPDCNAAIEGTIKKGDSVIIHEEIGDFYRIGANQYCMKKYIEIEE